MSTVSEVVATGDLAGLFAGDEHTAGYPTLELARRLCERIQPDTVTDLRHAIYGQLPLDEIPLEEREMMARGYACWRALRYRKTDDGA